MKEKVKKNYYILYCAESIWGDPNELDDYDKIVEDDLRKYENPRKELESLIKVLNRNYIFISEEKQEDKTIMIFGWKNKNARYKLEYNLEEDEEEDGTI